MNRFPRFRPGSKISSVHPLDWLLMHISQDIDPISSCFLYDVLDDAEIGFIVDASLWFYSRPHDTSNELMSWWLQFWRKKMSKKNSCKVTDFLPEQHLARHSSAAPSRRTFKPAAFINSKSSDSSFPHRMQKGRWDGLHVMTHRQSLNPIT